MQLCREKGLSRSIEGEVGGKNILRSAPAPESIEICVRALRLGGRAVREIIGRGSLDMSIVQPCGNRDWGYNGGDQIEQKYRVILGKWKILHQLFVCLLWDSIINPP